MLVNHLAVKAIERILRRTQVDQTLQPLNKEMGMAEGDYLSDYYIKGLD